MTNKNGDDFNGITIKLSDGTKIGELTNINPVHRDKVMQKVYELTYGPSVLPRLVKDMIVLDVIKAAQARTFFLAHQDLFTEEQRRTFMEKYGVQVDPKKVDDSKKQPGEKTAGADDPNVNVPKDPDKGTEPFEKKPEDD